VLGRDDNGVDTLGDDSTAIVGVLDGDLGLGVGSQPWEGAVVTGILHGLVELVGEEEGEGEEFGSLVGGITEHDTLVTSTELLQSLLVVQTLSNVGRLLLNGDEDVASLVVEALLGRVVANVLDGSADDLLVVEVGLGLAGNLGEGVLLQAGIEDGI
jgi:hypothetical protein